MIAFAASLFVAVVTAVPPQAPQGADTPSRIEWQRNLPDALAVQKATGLPLLIVVNMDGEVFNDRFATAVYTDPEFVELTRGYVCVVASPTPHNPRSHDALGRRIECPRFSGCTCGEHQDIEPLLYERWFGGKRNAPRHVGVGTDGKVLFDRYLDQSMQTAIDAIARHRGTPKPDAFPVTNDPALLLQRRDAAARRTIESMYAAGDAEQKRRILGATATATNEPTDLLRLGLAEDDDGLFAAAARALAALATKDSLPDVEAALARVGDPAVVQLLLGRLRTLGSTEPAAARLFSHFDWTTDEKLPEPWSGAWGSPAFDPASRESIEAELDRCEAALRATPDDDGQRLRLAVAQAALGEHLAATGAKGAMFWFEDAATSAKKVRAEALTAEVQAVLAVSAWQRSDAAAARAAATLALGTVKSERAPDPWLASRLLGVVVQTTAMAAYGKAAADPLASLRAELLRVELALQLLEARGQVVEGTHLAGAALLDYGGLRQFAERHLAATVARFPASATAHERWRSRLMIDLGAEGLRRRYAAFVAAAQDGPVAEWFAGYAAIVAAERHVDDERRAPAIAAYGEAIERFAKSAAGNAEYADSANHFAVLALAGRAAERHGAGDDDGAVADLLAAAALRPASLDESDGLKRKPRATADRIARGLRAAGKTELAAQLAPLLP